MKRPLIFCCAMALSGCDRAAEDRAAEKAEREFSFIIENGSTSDQCRAAKKAEAEWLKRENADKFKEWKAMRQTFCYSFDS